MGDTISGEEQIRAFYRALAAAWGPQHWWPARTRFEVVAGAFLTQNTGWSNVERALANLRATRTLSVDGIRRLPLDQLERLIRPSGYFRQKAQRLKAFVAFLDGAYGDSLARLFAQPTEALRQQLLTLKGVGPETADSILLYAGNHPVFVVDAYTRRILERHRLMPATADYEEIRVLFERALKNELAPTLAPPSGPPEGGAPQAYGKLLSAGRKFLYGAGHTPSAVSKAKRSAVAQAYNEMHALIVGVGKNYCAKSEPSCAHCPLGGPSFRPFL
jgi:endonuclease-3 related protein